MIYIKKFAKSVFRFKVNKTIRFLYYITLILISFSLKKANSLPRGFVYLSDIDASIHQDIRYASKNNFVGRSIKGYENQVCILTKEAAIALSKVQKELKQKYGKKYSLKVYDAYRPQKAVEDFWKWAQDPKDIKMKNLFYPRIKNKKDLFKGYIAKKSRHSRGSTIDLTIIDTTLQKKFNKNSFKDNSIEMGTIFDFLDTKSNTFSKEISPIALKNRKLLRGLMIKYGFQPYDKEWWHFSLKNEPFKKTYFDFSIY